MGEGPSRRVLSRDGLRLRPHLQDPEEVVSVKKIKSLFKREYGEGSRLVYDEVVEGAEWVRDGEGVATRKFDGTACMVRSGKLFKRYDCKAGKTPPAGFEPSQEPDEVTGHWPGWVPVGDGPEDQWHREALVNMGRAVPMCGECGDPMVLADGTYELCGPKVQGNPERFNAHVLVPHDGAPIEHAPRDFEGLREYLCIAGIEGVVWHHPDGRMVKIKGKDFGFKRKT